MVPGRFITPVGQNSKKSVSFSEFKKAESKIPRVLLITDKKSTPLLFKSLSLEYFNRLSFAEARHTSEDVVKELSLDSYPSLFIFPSDGGNPIKYEGSKF
jgi:protein disulfide-isomerase A6